MYRFTSSTEKKWRATSSIAPRHGKRGVSRMCTAGSVTGRGRWNITASYSPQDGSNWRSVCTP